MARFLTTSGINYVIEEIIKNAKQVLILVSPYLDINERLKILIDERCKDNLETRIIYGKKRLKKPVEDWVKEQKNIKLYFCKNLHAKCYMNESVCLVSSLNLYEFSQVNNHEMGILLRVSEDTKEYTQAYTEIDRLITVSTLQVKEIKKENTKSLNQEYKKLTTSKLAAKLKLKTIKMNEILIKNKLIEKDGDNFKLTNEGQKWGGEEKTGRYGKYILWPSEINIKKE